MNNNLSTTKQQSATNRSHEHNFFNSLFNLLDVSRHYDLAHMEPKIEVTENKNNVIVTAEIPGVNANDIDLSISSNGYLTISGEKKHENTSVSASNGYFSEISYGRVSRTIPLPWDITYEKATADYNNGVLTVTLPKNQATKTKQKINITNSSGSTLKAKKNKQKKK